MRGLLTCFLVGVVTLAALIPAPAARAQDGAVWTAAYYNDPYQLTEPVLTRTETSLWFNWGGSSPAPGVNANDFSAKFWADVAFAPGTYRFYILADDGVQLFAGDRAIWGEAAIDTYNNPLPGQTLTADVAFPQGGVNHIIINYRESTGDAYLYVRWENLAGGATGPGLPQPVSSMGVWSTQYFANTTLEGTPVLAREETIPAGDWGNGSPASQVPADNFSARWSGVRDLAAGTYTVSVAADDGVRVFVDGSLIINEWHGATGETYTNPFTVGAGQHIFVVEYYEATQNAFLHFGLAQAGTPPSTGSPAPVAPTSAAATVAVYRLNVRNAPSTITGQIITKVLRGETYPIVGRNTSGTWWQINVNGTVGWVYASLVRAVNTAGVPITFDDSVG